jgi:hypothetical protein
MMKRISGFKKRSYFWITLLLFILSLALHWMFAWKAFKNDQKAHNQPVVFSEYFDETFRDTMENWQSEFLQLIWQVVGLSFLYYVGSPSSKEGDDRKEEKIDYLIKLLDKEEGEKVLKELERKYPKK